MPSPNRSGRTRGRAVGAASSEADLAALGAAKRELRRAIGERRAARPAARRATDDAARTAAVFEFLLPHLHPGWTTAAYLSRDAEPATLDLVARLGVVSRVLLPVIRGVEPDWARYTGPDDLALGRFGIVQPTGPALGAAALADADVVIAPALAATPRGDRLGVGGGWYDRALAHARAETVVVALLNDDEVLPTLPTQPWDRRVDVLATPAGLTAVSPAG